jgi:hypothetical protein
MKAYWGSGGIAPLIIDLGTRWRWVVSFTPRPLYPQGENPWYPLDRRLGGPQSRSGHSGGGEKNPCHCWESNSCRPARRRVTELTELPRFPIIVTSLPKYEYCCRSRLCNLIVIKTCLCMFQLAPVTIATHWHQLCASCGPDKTCVFVCLIAKNEWSVFRATNCVKLGSNASYTCAMLFETYGGEAVKKSSVFE